MVASLGAASVADGVRAAAAAGVTALILATVSDFAVLRPDPAAGLRARRDFGPGEAYADHRRQLAAVRRAVAGAGAAVATSAADVDRAARDGRTVVLLGCEGGDFLEGDLGRLEEARAAGVTVLTLVHYRVSQIGDVQTEPPVHGGLSRFGRAVVALTEVAGPGHVAIGTDLDGNYRPVLTSYHQFADLASLLRDRGLPVAHVRQVLGGNAADLLNRAGL